MFRGVQGMSVRFTRRIEYVLTDFSTFHSPDAARSRNRREISARLKNFDIRRIPGCFMPLDFVVLKSRTFPSTGKSFRMHDFSHIR